jgi:ribosomal protein L7/L12
MITLWIDPGAAKLQVVKAIKVVTKCGLREAKDAVDLQRVNCKPEQREALIKALEAAGAKIL